METWKIVFLRFYPKKFLKFLSETRNNLLAVESGIKPSYLFDLFSTTSSDLTCWISALVEQGYLNASVVILELDGTLFACNALLAEENLKKPLTAEEICFIDVSYHLKEPRMLDSLADVFENFREIQKCIVSSHSEKILLSKFNLAANINTTSIFGLLLGYPVVYWFEEPYDVHSGDCLSSLPLINVKISSNSSKLGKTNIYSFTYPCCVEDKSKDFVVRWLKRLESRANELELEIESATQVVTSPVIAM